MVSVYNVYTKSCRISIINRNRGLGLFPPLQDQASETPTPIWNVTLELALAPAEAERMQDLWVLSLPDPYKERIQ